MDLIYLVTELAKPEVVDKVVYFQSICAATTVSRLMDGLDGIVKD